MKQQIMPSTKAISSGLPIAATALAIGIFIADTITDLEIALAVFYIVVVLMSVAFCRRRGVVLLSAGCGVLTVMSYFLTSTGEPEAGLINCVISVAALAIATYVVLRIKSAETAAYEARAELAHMARVMTMGELAASIAHEVTQPLTAVTTNAQACLRWLAALPPNLDEARQAIDRIVKDADRASEVVKRVRRLAKKTAPKKDLLSVNDSIREIMPLIRTDTHGNGIFLRIELADDLPPVLADRIELQQVMLNLVVNAIESISNVGGEPRELVVTSAKDGSEGLVVSVADSGKGVEPDKLDRLFDPFQTTKRDGLGIGLTISRSIIEAHGGRIWAEPNLPRGAVFRFTLPIGEGQR